MANTDSLFKEFFNTIGSTSAFEAVRKLTKVDALKLTKELQFAKFSDLGTPVMDYVELTLDEDVLDAPKGPGLAFSSGSAISNIANTVKSGIAKQVYQHGINTKSLHLNNVEVVVSLTNNIVRTSINGASGTFKEFYNQGDHIVNLTGSLIGSIPFQNDLINLNNFTRIYLANKRFNIKSTFVNDTFAVYGVVLSDFTFTLNKEYNNVVDYQMTLESDNDIEIIQ